MNLYFYGMKLLLDNPKNIILKADELSKITNKKEREEYIKDHAFVNIKPTPLANIMIDIYYDINFQLSNEKFIEIGYYAQDGGSSRIPYYCGQQQYLKTTDDKCNVLRLIHTQTQDFRIIDRISFDCKLKTDFSFTPFVYFKYVYRIYGGKYYREIITPDGQCSHEQGDSFSYEGREITIMEIDHNAGIVSCGATGDLSST